MATGKNFEYLGQQFQLQLLNQIIVDKDFSHTIIEICFAIQLVRDKCLVSLQL